MTVKTILNRKGTSVRTIAPSLTLAEAARMLNEHRIGAVLVTNENGGIDGLLSERDIVRALAEKGAVALALPVEKVMTRRVVTCREGDTVGEIMEQMTHGKFRHVPVVQGEKLVGIISIGDVVKYRLEEMEAESSAMREYIATA